jgi:hypothetical protein
MTFSSQYGQSGQLLFFLTGSPPRIASLPAFLLILLYAGTLRDIAAIVPTDAVARSCRLVKLLLFILFPFTLSSQCGLSVPIYLILLAWPPEVN